MPEFGRIKENIEQLARLAVAKLTPNRQTDWREPGGHVNLVAMNQSASRR